MRIRNVFLWCKNIDKTQKTALGELEIEEKKTQGSVNFLFSEQ